MECMQAEGETAGPAVPALAPLTACHPCMLIAGVQKRGLAVKEFELIKKNFSATGNFGKQAWRRRRRVCAHSTHVEARACGCMGFWHMGG